MQRYLALLVLALASVVSAHFQLSFPPPRGKFNEESEINFCDGYKTTAENRTTFPLSGGIFTLNSEHPQFTTGVIVSTAENPTSFDNFTDTVVPFFQTNGEGLFCFHLDFASSVNASNFKDGQNVTIQVVFDGGDKNLYQCADLTLSNNFQISSDVKCTNATGSSPASTATTPGSTASPTGSGAPAATTTSAAALGKEISAAVVGLALAVLGLGVVAL